MILRLNTTIKMKGFRQTVLILMLYCGSGISSRSSLHIFVAAVGLFSQLSANIFPGSAVGIREEGLLLG